MNFYRVNAYGKERTIEADTYTRDDKRGVAFYNGPYGVYPNTEYHEIAYFSFVESIERIGRAPDVSVVREDSSLPSEGQEG